MDDGTIAAIVALVVALIALLVAFAQVIQQYVATADLMRKCGSIVYGPLPGKGRRVWVVRQLRFKVVYSIPQISLRADLWPSRAPFEGTYSQANGNLPCIAAHKVQYSPGEASWVSFCRATQHSCFRATFYLLVEGDADRCPSDFPVILMQVSSRDIIVMAMMTGMRIISVENGIAMRGRAGIITSAVHTTFGTVMHYTPANVASEFGLTGMGDISPNWMSRLWGESPVAERNLDGRERACIENMECK